MGTLISSSELSSIITITKAYVKSQQVFQKYSLLMQNRAVPIKIALSFRNFQVKQLIFFFHLKPHPCPHLKKSTNTNYSKSFETSLIFIQSKAVFSSSYSQDSMLQCFCSTYHRWLQGTVKTKNYHIRCCRLFHKIALAWVACLLIIISYKPGFFFSALLGEIKTVGS